MAGVGSPPSEKHVLHSNSTISAELAARRVPLTAFQTQREVKAGAARVNANRRDSKALDMIASVPLILKSPHLTHTNCGIGQLRLCHDGTMCARKFQFFDQKYVIATLNQRRFRRRKGDIGVCRCSYGLRRPAPRCCSCREGSGKVPILGAIGHRKPVRASESLMGGDACLRAVLVMFATVASPQTENCAGASQGRRFDPRRCP